MVKVVRPVMAESQARQAGIDRPDLSRAIESAVEGTHAGVYREGDELLSIIARLPETERVDLDNLGAEISRKNELLDRVQPIGEELGMRAVLCFGATERNGGSSEARRGIAECRRFRDRKVGELPADDRPERGVEADADRAHTTPSSRSFCSGTTPSSQPRAA